MGLVTACQGCGKGVTGALTRLTKVNGKYFCSSCSENPGGVARYYCMNCKAYSPFARNKGSGWIELILWLCYIVPGVIYSIWRRTGNNKLCPVCKQATLITAEAGTHVRCPECAELVLKEARKCKHCGCGLVPQ